MADQEEEDLRTALRMSMQSSPPEPKRSKPRDGGTPVESPEDLRRMKRELMAAAAEKRLLETSVSFPSPSQSPSPSKATADKNPVKSADSVRKEVDFGVKEGSSGKELSIEEANELFSMVFGSGVSKDILAQWSNQGLRFSCDPETSMGLVQHEGGPCGVLATLQAFVLKHLLFFPDEIGKVTSNVPQNLDSGRLSKSQYVASDNFSSLTEDAKARALVKSMDEILFMCGDKKRAVIATLNVVGLNIEGFAKNEIIAKALEGLTIETGSDLQKILRIDTYTSETIALQKLHTALRMGHDCSLFPPSVRGIWTQFKLTGPIPPSLVTAPFGHASQEIVNLLLCGQAVPNVFDGRMDFGGGIVILDLDKSQGGLKDSSGLMGKKVFDLYHFNGIAKSDINGSHATSGAETLVQRPRLTKLKVSVPPRWTPEEFMADVVVSSGPGGNESSGKDTEVTKPEPSQHAPLVDCIRTRWSSSRLQLVGIRQYGECLSSPASFNVLLLMENTDDI
uniref:Deubiquitinating enzyme MINDY-3/4 conserved domain-containing protein n=1 Tax=Salix viminalis TaxID=40686 RepID=A0A6N2NKG2_SALVM